ncbi:hypothetical protein BDZ94DRAFT_1242305 [Collybia nuda]|uniref:Uncharacterized protein n=1 Tax=Collybia nuda TaxID=64659 RepID=A0A9P5XPT3_9AGAR|nr:hypothetical protein BDZ94DRAFT_1242305 [Collybia nuda]
MDLWPSIHQARMRPRVVPVTGGEIGEIRIEGIEEDPVAQQTYLQLLNDLSTIGLRVVMLVEASHFAISRKKDAKRDLKDKMDVDEGDDALRKADLAKAVKTAVDAAFKAKHMQPVPKNLKFKKGAAKGGAPSASTPARKGKSKAGKPSEPQPRQAAKYAAMRKNGPGLKGKKSSQARASSGKGKGSKGKGRA